MALSKFWIRMERTDSVAGRRSVAADKRTAQPAVAIDRHLTMRGTSTKLSHSTRKLHVSADDASRMQIIR